MDLSCSEIHVRVLSCVLDIFCNRYPRRNMFKAELLILTPLPGYILPSLSISVNGNQIFPCLGQNTCSQTCLLPWLLPKPPPPWPDYVAVASYLVSLVFPLTFYSLFSSQLQRRIMQVSHVPHWMKTVQWFISFRVKSRVLAVTCVIQS